MTLKPPSSERWRIIMRDGTERLIEATGPPCVLTCLATQRSIGAQFTLTSGELFNATYTEVARATKED